MISNHIARFRDDFRLAIITVLGTTTALALVGFSFWRGGRSEWLQMGFDLVVALGIGTIVRLAWYEGRTPIAGALMVVCNTMFCMAAWPIVGADAVGWIYLVLLTNFYMASTRMATWGGLLLLAVSTTALMVTQPGTYHFGIPVTWALVFAFSYAFSRRLATYSDSLELRANRDPLTQMPNRGMLEARLRSIVGGREAGRVGLLVLDLDRFKSINDTHGHGAGDAVLVALADVLRDELRQGDSMYRFGGEEFVLVLPIGSRAALQTAAERVRLAVASRLASPAGAVTVSIGGALHSGETEWQDWFARADTSLYLAKRSGRNQVHIAESMP